MRRNEMAILHWLFVLASTEVMARSYERSGPLRRTKSKDRKAPELVFYQLLPHHHVTQRRRLEAGEPADDLIDPLYQGHGTHYVDLWVGCPPQRQTVIIDTGSSQTAFPCTGCENCGASSSHTDGVFRQAESSCYREVTCEEECEHGECRNNTQTGKSYCHMSARYVEGSSWEAIESVDKAYTGGNHLEVDWKDEDDTGINFRFGCQTSLWGQFITQLEDGIMGLSMDSPSYWNQMHDAGRLKAFQFSLCFTKAPTATRQGTGAGAMIMGGTDTRLHTTPMVYAKQISTETEFYSLQLERMYLRMGGGESVLPNSDDAVRHNVVIKSDDLNAGGLIVDSGTSTTLLTEKLLEPFKDAWKRVTGKDYNEDMLEVSHEELMALPTIIFQFTPWSESNDGSLPGITGESFDRSHPNSILVAFPPSHYFSYLPARGTYVSHVFFRVKKGKTQTLGANFLMGKDVHFDLEKNRIGFSESKCEYSTLGLPNFPISNNTLAPDPDEVPVDQSAAGEGLPIPIDSSPDDTGTVSATPASDDDITLASKGTAGTCSSQTCQRVLMIGFLGWVGFVAGILLRNPRIPSRYHIATQLEESSGNCELKQFGRFSDKVGGMEVIDEDDDDDANGDDDVSDGEGSVSDGEGSSSDGERSVQ
jgi:hypothetical protein